MGSKRFPDPPHAYVPGQTQRHPETRFEALRKAAKDGMSAEELARSDAWQAGWQFLETGFYWEAHEVWEPVWLALPERSTERVFVQAAIQTANAALKAQMNRPAATLRLCRIVEGLLEEAPSALGRSKADITPLLEALSSAANPRT